jgi:hypothetical protein
MDVRRNPVGHSLSFEHRNPAEISEQSPQDVSQRPLVHTKHTDLQMSTVRDEIIKFSTNYRAKLIMHPNELTSTLLTEPGPRRLKRFRPTDLPTTCRF